MTLLPARSRRLAFSVTSSRWIHGTTQILAITLLLGGSCSLAAERDPKWNYPPELPGAQVETYKRIGDVDLNAWIFQPHRETDQNEPRPAIVFFFGGGWRGGTPGQFLDQCRYLASRGMVAITVDYRVRQRHDVLAPVCLADAKSAIRWVRRHARRLGIDPQKIVASGGSAGGHLAACTGTITGFDEPGEDTSISAIPNAMALYNPAVLLARIDGEQNLPDEKLTDLHERTDGKPQELSPLLHVSENQPPTIIFHGTDDEAVPFWTVERFSQAMQQAGNRCELKAYPGAPHGFFNTGRGGSAERQDLEALRFGMTTRQLDEFLQSLGYLQGPATILSSSNRNIRLRSSFPNSWNRFHETGAGRVVFMGGSITEMDGYRPMVSQWLKQQLPAVDFTFVNAGIASTCSLTGASRLERDVLSGGSVDLFLVEFAVNDDQDASHSPTGCVRGMEGIIRHLRTAQPMADIIMIHFVNPDMLEQIQRVETPVSIAAHEAVARHYGVNSVYLAREIAERISANEMTWKDYGGTHPAPAGNAVCAALVESLLEDAWAGAQRAGQQPAPHTLPQPLDPCSYSAAAFVRHELITIAPESGWKWEVPDWKSIPGQFRGRFGGRELLVADAAGSSFTVQFSGSMLAAYLLAGPDAGQLEVRIDGGEPRTIELYHRFSRGLHYPRTVLLADELPSARHTAVVRLLPAHHPDSRGTAARILELVNH